MVSERFGLLRSRIGLQRLSGLEPKRSVEEAQRFELARLHLVHKLM